MTVPTITAVRLTGAANRAELPLLVLGVAELCGILVAVHVRSGVAGRC